MISYCVVMIRPKFVKMLIEDLARKTKMPYEILLWLNVDNWEFERYVTIQRETGIPVKIIGKTPKNIGMAGFKACFEAAKGDIITQIDDDVIRVSPGTAEIAEFIFRKRPDIRHLSANMVESKYFGYRIPWGERWKCFDPALELYEGPIDGWFSMYHRDILPMLLELPYQTRLVSIGYMIAQRLRVSKTRRPALCKPLKVFHVKGPVYMSYYDMLDLQIWKFKQESSMTPERRKSIDGWAKAKSWVPPKEDGRAAPRRRKTL